MQPITLTSKGMGANYIKSINAINNKRGQDYYITKTGHKLALPQYYKNKILTEKEKEEAWLKKLDENTRYVDGIKIDVSKGQEEYISIRNAKRAKYIELGYNGKFNWNEKEYEEQRRIMLQKTRINEVTTEQTKTDENDLSRFTNINEWL